MTDTHKTIGPLGPQLRNGMFSFTSITKDEATGAVVAEYERGDGAPSMAVAALVAEEKGVDPRELDVVYDIIDPDALDSLFDGSRARFANAAVSFTYEGYDVRISHDTITISRSP